MSKESQIRSLKPFAGALLFAIAIKNDQDQFRWAMSHPCGPSGCCALHLAATLPGGEDAQWILEYATTSAVPLYYTPPPKPGDAYYATLPGPGVDPRIDAWIRWGSMEEKCKRCLASLTSGNIHAIDNSHNRIFEMRAGSAPEEPPELIAAVISEQVNQIGNIHRMSLDQLEQLACRGSKFATGILMRRLAASENPDEEARFVFWSFVYCSVYNGQVNNIFRNRAFRETKMGVFQLGKCFSDAKGYGSWLDSAHACAEMCFEDSSVLTDSTQSMIAYYIRQYQKAEEQARKSIEFWSCGMMKQGLIYDVRHTIVKLLWDARWTWVPEWKSEETVKRLKALYNKRPTPLSGAN